MTGVAVVLIIVIAFQMLTIAGLLWFHVEQSKDWREERAMLVQAQMARSLPEFRGPVPQFRPRQSNPFEDLEGYESPVGL